MIACIRDIMSILYSVGQSTLNYVEYKKLPMITAIYPPRVYVFIRAGLSCECFINIICDI